MTDWQNIVRCWKRGEDSPDYNTGRKYWNKLKQRLKEKIKKLKKVLAFEKNLCYNNIR